MASRNTQWSKQTAVFVVTVVAVVLAFMVATAVVLMRSRGIGESAHQIIDNAVPGLEALIGAGTDLELLRVRMERYLDAPGRPRRELAWQSIYGMREHIADYIALPSYPGERQLQGELLSRTNRMLVDIRRVFALAEAGAREDARQLVQNELETSFQEIEELITQGQQINAQAVRNFTRRMEGTRAAARRYAIVLNALCAVIAAFLLIWAVRSMRRQRALEAEYAAVLRDRAEELELFASRVAHDVLSPLASSALALEMLARTGDEKVRRSAQRGLGGIAKVRATVDGLLEFARAGARPPEGVVSDLVEVTQDVVSGLDEQARAAGICLELSVPQGGRDVAASRGVLTSILTNLVQNATKYMGPATERRVSVRVSDRGARVRVEVQDTGPGIPPGMEQRIFEPYFRAKGREAPLGLGLGLATVRRLVDAHGGTVAVESTPGRGATFAFELPGYARTLPPGGPISDEPDPA